MVLGEEMTYSGAQDLMEGEEQAVAVTQDIDLVEGKASRFWFRSSSLFLCKGEEADSYAMTEGEQKLLKPKIPLLPQPSGSKLWNCSRKRRDF